MHLSGCVESNRRFNVDNSGPVIAVASRSFSANGFLRQRLLEVFPDCRFNDEGLRLEGDSLAALLQGAPGAIVGIERIDVALLNRLPDLRVLSKYGVGLDSIDVDELARKGVVLATAPGTNALAVAELALFLSMATLRRIPEALANIGSEKWTPVTGRLLSGKVVGLVGVGHVGRALIKLVQPFGCRVLGFDSLDMQVPGVLFGTLDELLESSDVVSIHLPLTTFTRHLIGRRELDLMKPSSVLVNTSRGPIINQSDLLAALKNGVIAAAGLDVLESEPPPSWDLAGMHNVILTPHIAGSSEESNLAMGLAAIDGLIANRDRLRP
jgi:D-3-phosphoglycerate dehydrogenase